jgi:hypothetical protein
MVNPKLDSLINLYYARKDVQDAIYNFCRNREVVPRYGEGFGKRPDTLEYPSDIMQQAKKGATSFHCSEELWTRPLEISTEMTKEQLDEMRDSWDLLIDIDSKYLDYSKIMAKLIVQALEFHSIKNIGIKFSGSKGFHLIIPWKAFPDKVNGLETKKMFPDWARIVSMYIHEFVKPKLIEKISELTSEKTSKYITGDEKAGDSVEKVAPDIVLVSSRHLFRTPYSLHEKTGLASIVITKQELENFQPSDADPLKVKIRNYMPESKEGEARELLIQALDWYKEKIQNETKTNKTGKVYKEIEIDRSKIVYPPCIQCMLKGLKDGKKRSLFILISYLNSLNFSRQEIEEKITEWNAKNTPPLKQGYVDSQLSYAFKHKKIMPPNCDKYYKDINICRPAALCQKIKNPLNYTICSQKKFPQDND